MLKQNKLHTNTFTYFFSLRIVKQNKNGSIPIYITITLNGKRFSISLGIKLSPDETWESLSHGQARILGSNPETYYKNEVMTNFLQKLVEVVRDANAKARKLSNKQLKSLLLDKNPQEKTIFDFLDFYHKHRQSLGDLSAKTLNKDKHFIKSWKGVAKHFGIQENDFYASDLSLKFAHKIVIFMRTEREPFRQSFSQTNFCLS